MFSKENIYIAGPECFYTRGYVTLDSMKRRAESFGMGVTLPNDNFKDINNPDLQKRADSIFDDLVVVMNETTAIIADLEAFRGSEADSGTVYELGMAYAVGARCYGYARDKRPLANKDQKYVLKNDIVYDEAGRVAPYMDLPFSPCVIASTKIVEGDFDDCLKMMMTDIEEEYKQQGRSSEVEKLSEVKETKEERERPLVYLSSVDRYDEDAVEKYEIMKDICNKYNLDAISPLDEAERIAVMETDNPYVKAANILEHYESHVRNCDIIIADLNDFRGYECSNDVAFETGMGYMLGKKMFGYMDDTTIMANRLPHYGEEKEFRDHTGSNVENFDYPLNLMFASSMEIFEGKFEDIIRDVVKRLED